jgi:hypothetical protein
MPPAWASLIPHRPSRAVGVFLRLGNGAGLLGGLARLPYTIGTTGGKHYGRRRFGAGKFRDQCGTEADGRRVRRRA